MFLRPLDPEQKKLFLGLAKKAAEANGVVEEAEKKLLYAYADEMGINVTDASNLSLEEILSNLKKISGRVQINQMAFEIVGMIMSDNEYDDDEKVFMEKVASILEIKKEVIDEMFECVNKYDSLIHKIFDLMNA